jgi:hypothetical protein
MEHIPAKEIRVGDAVKINNQIRTVLDVRPFQKALSICLTHDDDEEGGAFIYITKSYDETVEVVSRGPEPKAPVLERLEAMVRDRGICTMSLVVTDDGDFVVHLDGWRRTASTLEAAIEAALKVAHDS